MGTGNKSALAYAGAGAAIATAYTAVHLVFAIQRNNIDNTHGIHSVVATALPWALGALALAALGFWLGRKMESLAELAIHDPLTGLHNRRYVDMRLVQEFKRAQRLGSSISILFVDVDRLKHINDFYGHKAGDRVIMTVADALRSCCRASDILARVGGDEFVVVALDTGAANAVQLANRICEEVARLGAPLGYGEVSVSVGVDGASKLVTEFPALVETADAALCAVKRARRDRTNKRAGQHSNVACFS